MENTPQKKAILFISSYNKSETVSIVILTSYLKDTIAILVYL